MTQGNMFSRMYLANVVEENDRGFHRETLWYGGTAANLGLLIIDAMKDWYEPNLANLDESIIKYHKMLEDKEKLTFDMVAGEGFNTGGMRLTVKISNNLNEMFNFIINEICDIFAENGETPSSFSSLAEFKEHFVSTYDIDEGLKSVLEGVNEITISKALYLIDIKYNYTQRHFKSGNQQ